MIWALHWRDQMRLGRAPLTAPQVMLELVFSKSRPQVFALTELRQMAIFRLLPGRNSTCWCCLPNGAFGS